MSDATRETLRRAGLRCTPARERVLREIERLARPVSHAELVRRRSLADMDPITLYRTLASLEEGGLVHRVQGTDGVWRACAQPRRRSGCPGNHPHLQCSACGRMACLSEQPLPRVEVPDGWVVAGRQFVAWGTCDQCVAADDVH